MKKSLLALIAFIICLQCCFAQTPNDNTFPTPGGFVGIDTLHPPFSLTLAQKSTGFSHYYYSDGGSTNYIRFNSGWVNGAYNIGTYFGGTGTSGKAITIGVQSTAGGTTLQRTFTVNSGASVSAGNFNFSVSTGNAGSIVTLNTGLAGNGVRQNMLAIQGTVSQNDTSAAGFSVFQIAPYLQHVGRGPRFLIDAGINSAASAGGTHTSFLVLTDSGKMGLGTTNPGAYMLAVKGNVHAQQVNIDMTGWSDYVFYPGYHLPPLAEVKTYIDKNHRLPEMPSEAEVIKEGINVGDMNKLLMKKVEELTLYMIEKDKQLNEQEQEIKKLQDQVATLMTLIKTKNN